MSARDFAIVVVVAGVVALGIGTGCGISDNDPLPNIGAPCVVADGQCDVEHVCVANPGANTGHCAPVKSYGAACDAKIPVTHPPGRVGKDKDSTKIDVRGPEDIGLIQDVRSVTGELITFAQGADTVSLDDLCDFRTLQKVGNGFGVGDTDTITSLDGLQSVTTVHGGLAIFDNRKVEDIKGLGNLRDITPLQANARSVDVVIAGNPRLLDADVDAFLADLETRIGRPLQKVACNNQGRVCVGEEATLVATLIAAGIH